MWVVFACAERLCPGKVCASLSHMGKRACLLVQWAFLGVVVLGCSGKDSSGATCNAAAPCGGTLDGTWQIDGTCVEGDLPAYLAARKRQPSACGNAFQTATASLAGTITFANGMEADNLIFTFDAQAIYTAACVHAITGTTASLDANACISLQQTLINNGTFTGVTCSFAGENCACSGSILAEPATAQEAYAISGTQIVYADGSSSLDYCVSGTTLSTRDVEPDATFFNTAHKL